MMRGHPLFCYALFATFVQQSSAQSIFVDMDIMSGGIDVGAGAPSPAFGAAAGVPGFWNQVPSGNEGPWALRDISGSVTSVSMSWVGDGGGLGYNNPNLAGDFKLLMADAERVGAGGLRFTITGLSPGPYRIFTYACKPQGELWTTVITVPGSTSENPQAVTGPMPPNQFVLGVTHSIHDILLSGGPLEIVAAEHQNSYVNGFQILAVPEPASFFAFASLLTAMAVLRRRRM